MLVTNNNVGKQNIYDWSQQLEREGVENTLAVFEKRCKKTDELFDEWNCIFIMYTCLRKYCDKTKINYGELIHNVLKLQSDLEKEEKTEQ